MSKVALLTLLTKADCPYCATLERFLKQRGVEFEVLRVDVPQNQWLKVKMLEQGVSGLPALMHDNVIVPIGNRINLAVGTLRIWGLIEGGL